MQKDEILKLIKEFESKKEPDSEMVSETNRLHRFKNILDLVKENNLAQAKMGIRKVGAENNWQPISFGEYKIAKPIIFCVPGSGAVSHKDANAFCKRAENLIGLKTGCGEYATSDYVDLLGLSYAVVNRFSTNFAPEEIEKIAWDMLLPLCIDDDNKALPIDMAKKNLSMVTFFTHCHGAVEVCRIMEKLRDELISNYGYTDRDIKELFESVRQISYAPNIIADMTPSVRAFSFEDFFHYELDDEYELRYNKKLNGVDIEYNPEGSRMGRKYGSALFDNITIYSSKLRNGLSSLKDEHTFDRIARVDNWDLKRDQDDMGGAINADAVSKMFAYALASSVANGITNWQSDSYVPKRPLSEDISTLQDILDGYDSEQLRREYNNGGRDQ